MRLLAACSSRPCLHRRTPKLHHFQVRYIAVGSASSRTALLGGLKEDEVRKIFNAYRRIAKASQVSLPNTRGKRVDWSELTKMTYPFSAIGMLARVDRTAGIAIRGFCTGWLVRQSLVVTAAHCVFNHKTRLPVWPGHLRFLPQVWGGRRADELNGLWGYNVTALAIPGWYEQLGDTTATRTREDTYIWDMALLYLSESVACTRCQLRPAVVAGSTNYTDSVQVAGYGWPANERLQLNMSLPCNATLTPNMAYTYTKCSTFDGTSGAPYWPAAVPYEAIKSMPGVPANVMPFSWPAFGVHSGRSPGGRNAVMMQFTHAHLKWLHWAARPKIPFLSCSGTSAGRDTTRCVPYSGAEA